MIQRRMVTFVSAEAALAAIVADRTAAIKAANPLPSKPTGMPKEPSEGASEKVVKAYDDALAAYKAKVEAWEEACRSIKEKIVAEIGALPKTLEQIKARFNVPTAPTKPVGSLEFDSEVMRDYQEALRAYREAMAPLGGKIRRAFVASLTEVGIRHEHGHPELPGDVIVRTSTANRCRVVGCGSGTRPGRIFCRSHAGLRHLVGGRDFRDLRGSGEIRGVLLLEPMPEPRPRLEHIGAALRRSLAPTPTTEAVATA